MALFKGWRSKVAKWTYGILGVAESFASDVPEEVADVFTCIKILSENISKMTPQVKDADNKIIKHPLNLPLGRRPNDFQNPQAFWQTVEYTRNVYGNAYVYLDRANGFVKRMYALPNACVTAVEINAAGRMKYYVDFSQAPTCPFSNAKWIQSSDILHFKHQSKDGIFGEAPLIPLKSYASILSKASKMLASFYGNNAMSTLALKTEITKASVADAIKEAAEDFAEKHDGAQSGKIINIPPNSELVEINQKYADAQVIETQRYSKEQVGNLFGIPKFMLGITETDQSIEQQTKQFLALTLSPILQMYSSEMEFKMLRDDEFEKGIYVGYNTEKMIETDTKTKADTIALLVSKGLMTPDEGAIAMGNSPVGGEFGKLHWIQSQNNPIEYYNAWAKANNTDVTNNLENDKNKESKQE